MIRFACPGCSAAYSVPDEKAGKTGKCPKCQAQFLIPTPEPGPVAAPPPPRQPAPPPPPAATDEVEIAPCPGCQARLVVAAADLGAEVECPHCQAVYKAFRPGAVSPSRSPKPVAEESPRPSRRGKDDEDDRPSRRGRQSRRDEDADDDENDRPSRRGRRDEDEDEDEDDEDDRPSRRRRKKKSYGNDEGKGVRIASGVLSLLMGGLNLICGIAFVFGAAAFLSVISGVDAANPTNDPQQAQARGQAVKAAGALSGVFIGCGVGIALFALVYIAAGVGVLTRKNYGRILTIIVGSLSALAALLVFVGLVMSVFSGNFRAVGSGLVQLLIMGAHATTSLMCTLGRGSNQFR